VKANQKIRKKPRKCLMRRHALAKRPCMPFR
jgi:hypothetical protein